MSQKLLINEIFSMVTFLEHEKKIQEIQLMMKKLVKKVKTLKN